ncbi:MAG: 30S ribosomal protein S9 [Bacteroidetes bacterium]|nr:30S ribosomal protein S9 [Bacteroidota bacterium]
MDITHKIGRRKTAVARSYLKPGNGTIIVNNKDYKNYFPSEVLHHKITQAFSVSNTSNMYDASVNVFGGGMTGQAEAVRLAFARALCEINAELRPPLKANGLLTRDPRMVERKKPGQKKARKRFQFSKR